MQTTMEDLIDYLLGDLQSAPRARQTADLLRDIEDDIRAEAAGIPLDAETATDVSPLRKTAQTSGPVADVAKIALARRGDKEATALLEKLSKSGDAVIRRAAEASMPVGDEDATGRLISIAESTFETDERKADAIARLGAVRTNEAASALASLLKDGSRTVRLAAVDALAEAGATPELRDATSTLARALRDESHEVRVSAAKALGSLGDTSASDCLAEALKDQHGEVRKHAGLALSTFGDARAAGALVEALKKCSRSERTGIIRRLSRCGGEEALPALCEALREPHEDIRFEAARALGDLGGEQATTALEAAAAKEKTPAVREAIEESLATLGVPQAGESPADQTQPTDTAEHSRRENAEHPQQAETDATVSTSVVAMDAIRAIGCDYEPVRDGWELIIRTEGDRRRRVRITLGEADSSGEPLYRIRVDLGVADSKEFRKLLLRNATLTCGAIAVEHLRHIDRLVLTDVLPVKSTDAEGLKRIILSAAAVGGQLFDEVLSARPD